MKYHLYKGNKLKENGVVIIPLRKSTYNSNGGILLMNMKYTGVNAPVIFSFSPSWDTAGENSTFRFAFSLTAYF